MRLLFILFLFFEAFIAVSQAQAINTGKLDRLFNVLESRGLATGSVNISVSGKNVYRRAMGFAWLDENRKIPPDVHTRYRIGSVTKMFTAAMIFQLTEEGKLRLDDTLSEYFPQLPNAGAITLEQMLYHRSGLHDYTDDTDFFSWMDKPRTRDSMLKIIAAKGVDFEPGARSSYCNTNYLLLGYIVEKIDKMPYARALAKRIVSKTGLKNTHYGRSIDVKGNEAMSYKYADSVWIKQKETNPDIHGGAGGIVSTPADLTKFIRCLFEGKVVGEASLSRMTTIVEGFGMGLLPYDFDKVTGYGHNGRIEEFYTALRYYPDRELAISFITNGIIYPRSDILDGILNICFDKRYDLPFSQPRALRSFDMDKYPGEYSSDDLPFKVICERIGSRLLFKAAGRVMEAEPVSGHYFMNLRTGSFFEFNPGTGTLAIKETDNVYYLRKELKRQQMPADE